MILQDIPSALLSQDQSFGYVRGLVALVLLEHAGNGTTERRWLTQRDIANITGTSWEMVHVSLKSLQKEGAIRIERHRLIINRELLQKIAVGNAK
jgi:DNA-binding MarR family transcriptional regulator